MSQIKVSYIFRHPRAYFFSIEKVFKQIISVVERKSVVVEIYVPYERIRPLELLKNIQFVKKYKADVFHITGDVHYLAMALPKQKTILTIHDCVFLEDTKGLKRIFLKLLLLTLPVRHASFITTISQKSKEEIIEHTGCQSNKIQVIHNPVGESIYYVPRTFNSTKPIILFLGTKDTKNLHRSIKALNGINCQLDIVGPLTDLDLTILKENKVSFSQSINISEQEIADKYAECDIVLFPSIYEGFGLPIIEGNKAGRVVVTSNLPPMNEIAADAACLVDPCSITSIKEGIEKVIALPTYRELLIEAGFRNIRRFEPEYIACQYKALYQKMLS